MSRALMKRKYNMRWTWSSMHLQEENPDRIDDAFDSILKTPFGKRRPEG